VSSEFIVPVEQATVLFFGQPVIAVRLSDGRIGAVISNMCSILKMDVASQVRRLRDDETTVDSLVQVQIQTENRGLQAMGVLIAWAIPYWLSNIQLSRIKDNQKREAIAYFKKEAANVLYAYFSQRVPALPGPTPTIVPAEPKQPAHPAQDADALAWAEYHRQMVAYYEWKAATDIRIDLLEERQAEIESRLDEHRRVLAFIPEILERLGSETLTTEHQRAVQRLVKKLHDATSKPYGTIYDELKTAFNVPRYQEIRESEWDKVLHWFQVQIERADGKKP
jgi:hypothetical protein